MLHRHRVTIDLPQRMHQQLKAGARRRGVTLGAFVRMLLQEQLSHIKAGSSGGGARTKRESASVSRDPVTEHLKQFVDREALRRNLRMTPEERIRALDKEMDRARRDSALPDSTGITAPDDMPWFGVLQAKAAHAKARHDTASVSASIARARKKKPR